MCNASSTVHSPNHQHSAVKVHRQRHTAVWLSTDHPGMCIRESPANHVYTGQEPKLTRSMFYKETRWLRMHEPSGTRGSNQQGPVA